jgi:hypothetical protein
MSSLPSPDQDPVFEKLVTDDKDLPGLLAYSLYCLTRRDWTAGFHKKHQRPPTETEIDIFMTGETTERRIADYRTLAEKKLAASTLPVADGPAPTGLAALAAQPKPKIKELIIRLSMLGVAVVVSGLIIRFFLVRP